MLLLIGPGQAAFVFLLSLTYPRSAFSSIRAPGRSASFDSIPTVFLAHATMRRKDWFVASMGRESDWTDRLRIAVGERVLLAASARKLQPGDAVAERTKSMAELK